jgi:hypothetical protein
MTTKMRSLVATVLALAVLLSAGCSGKGDEQKGKEREPRRDNSRGDKGPGPSGGDKGQGTDLRDAKPAFRVTSKQLGEEYKKDKKAAEAKYKGKVIEVTGLVTGIGQSINKEPCLTLEGAEKGVLDVMCFTAEKEPWAKAAPGQTVKLKGTCAEFSFMARLTGCAVLEVTGPAPPSLRAEELAKEYAAGADKASMKYNDKYLLLSGEVAGVKFNEDKAASVTLKTSGKPKVVCHFTEFEKDETAGLKPGQKIKVLGQYTMNLSPDEVGLYFCMPVGAGK